MYAYQLLLYLCVCACVCVYVRTCVHASMYTFACMHTLACSIHTHAHTEGQLTLVNIMSPFNAISSTSSIVATKPQNEQCSELVVQLEYSVKVSRDI